MFLDEYEKTIRKIYKENNLISLSDYDLLNFDGQNALSFLHLITKSRSHLKQSSINFDLLTEDLINSISPDIKFSLANALLFFPGANNFLKEMRINPDGSITPTYFRTLADKRFFYYVNTTFEKLYIFWDRIGDILALCFGLNLAEKNVYFSTVIKELDKNNSFNSENWDWLKNFHDTEYVNILNRLRIKIVHYRQKDTYFFHEWIDIAAHHSGDMEKIKQLQAEKDNLPDLLKSQLTLTHTGFEKTVRLIREHGLYEQS